MKNAVIQKRRPVAYKWLPLMIGAMAFSATPSVHADAGMESAAMVSAPTYAISRLAFSGIIRSDFHSSDFSFSDFTVAEPIPSRYAPNIVAPANIPATMVSASGFYTAQTAGVKCGPSGLRTAALGDSPSYRAITPVSRPLTRLEQMRMTQAGGDAVPAISYAALTPAAPAPVTPCVAQGFNQIGPGKAGPGPEKQNFSQSFRRDFGSPGNGTKELILGSRAISVSRTPFDANWARINAAAPTGAMHRGLLESGATRTGDARRKIALINSWVNSHIGFSDDRRLYQRGDYWASAGETFAKGAGDCEDFAIAKMQLLEMAGIPRDNMRLVIARDLARSADHAVLVVTIGADLLLLDNATDLLLDARLPNDYRPIMSYAGGRKWLHGYAPRQDRGNESLARNGGGAAVSVAALSVPSMPLTAP